MEPPNLVRLSDDMMAKRPTFSTKALTGFFKSLLGLTLKSLPIWLIAFLAWSYYATQVPDRYQTTTTFVVRGAKDVASPPPAAALLGIPDSGFTDAFVVREHIQSLEMLQALDREFGILKNYRQYNIDKHFKLKTNSKTQTVLDYYRDLVQVNYDQMTGLITLKVQDFDPKRSKAIASYVVRRSEVFINQMSHQVANSQFTFADKQLSEVRAKLGEAQEKLLTFQNKYGIVSPEQEVQLRSSLINTLESELAAREVELQTASAYLSEDSFRIQNLQEQVANLRSKLDSYRDDLAGGGPKVDQSKIAELQKDFSRLSLDVKFWTDTYASTLTSLQSTRLEALQKLKFLLMVTQPYTPPRSEFPNRPYIVLTVTLLGALAYGAIRLVVLTIWDHQDR